jgi:hypothetical protein
MASDVAREFLFAIFTPSPFGRFCEAKIGRRGYAQPLRMLLPHPAGYQPTSGELLCFARLFSCHRHGKGIAFAIPDQSFTGLVAMMMRTTVTISTNRFPSHHLKMPDPPMDRGADMSGSAVRMLHGNCKSFLFALNGDPPENKLV